MVVPSWATAWRRRKTEMRISPISVYVVEEQENLMCTIVVGAAVVVVTAAVVASLRCKRELYTASSTITVSMADFSNRQRFGPWLRAGDRNSRLPIRLFEQSVAQAFC